MAIAWSTAALLLGLLPGFAFLAGLAAGEPYSRDNTPKSPLAQLALIGLISALIHALLISLSAPLPVPDASVPEILKALMATGGREASEVGTNVERNLGWVTAYLLLAVTVSGFAGLSTARLALRNRAVASVISEHSWIYDILRSNTRSTLAAFVLTRSGNDERHLLYKGTLHKFGLRADGRFAYLVIEGAVRFTLHVESGRTTSDEPVVIGEELQAPKWLYLDGEEIANVFFGGISVITGARASETVEEVRRRLEPSME